MDLETLYYAWERYKDLLRRWPHHGLPLWLQVQTFYNGVNPSTRQMIDAAAGGTINNKTPEEAYKFIEEMSLNNYQWQVMKTKPTKITGVYNVDSVTILSNQVELLNKKIDGLLGSTQVHPVMQCEASGGRSSNPEYQAYGHNMENKQLNYMGNNPRSQNNPYSNTYSASWRNHPNISWGSQGNQRPPPPSGFQQPPYQQEKKPNLEEMLSKFISVSETHFQNIEIALKNQQASIQRLETQIGQLSKLISERPQGSLPSNTEPNPREQLNAINVQDKEGFVEPEPELMQETVVSKGKGEVSHNENKTMNVEYKPCVPCPNAMRKDRSDEQFGNFLKLLKNLHINLPFIEDLLQMLNAMKFLKELLANKLKLDEASHIELNVVCSAILQNKLPYKLKDPGSFTIPCIIGSLDVNNALADLGASINVMPYKMFKQLDIEEDNNTPLILGRPFLATAKTIIDVGTGELTLCVGDETITLQARNSSITSNIEGNCPHHSTKTDSMAQPTLQKLSLKEVHEPCSNNNRGPIHEERRLQTEELDEWRAHNPRKHDKPKLRQNGLDTSPNLLKVGDKVLLDAADPYIVTAHRSSHCHCQTERRNPSYGSPQRHGQAHGRAYDRVETGQRFSQNMGYDKSPRPWANLSKQHGRVTRPCLRTVVETEKLAPACDTPVSNSYGRTC
ncbi:hypothetical protein CXB51_019840 [Gossypium anomalum]|uniref:Retrotransposon gag domain-containing protein n=1 Tax=Gossypium anomalum TaxID=47600 RepID=A0A8J5Z026_9ROSI|nr:hypothetical protein CXB51_019840 [Gossypium anomalum]